jgi:superfamily II DNA or RNA helicase
LNIVASIDFVKSTSQREQFLANAPDLIIIDEAHSAARPRGAASGAEHQRYELLRDLARDPNRQILLVTATPHSGIEESFRSLLGLLEPEFDRDPAQTLDREELFRTSSSAAAGMLRSGSGQTLLSLTARLKRRATNCRVVTKVSSRMCSNTAANP